MAREPWQCQGALSAPSWWLQQCPGSCPAAHGLLLLPSGMLATLAPLRTQPKFPFPWIWGQLGFGAALLCPDTHSREAGTNPGLTLGQH